MTATNPTRKSAILNLKNSPTVFHICWHLAAALLIFFVPSQLLLGQPAYSLTGRPALVVYGFVLSYLLGALILILRTKTQPPVRPAGVLALSVTGFGALAIALQLANYSPERIVFVSLLGLSIIFLVLPFLLPRLARWPTLLLIAVTTLAGQIAGSHLKSLSTARQNSNADSVTEARIIDSAYHPIAIRFYDNFLLQCGPARQNCTQPRAGGALSLLGSGYLVTTGDGFMHFVEQETAAGKLLSRPLAYRAPLNADSFAHDVGSAGLSRFRVTGSVVQEQGGRFRIFLAHHFWKSLEACYVVRVSSIEGSLDELVSGATKLNWRTVFDTTPCLKANGETFYGDESGGRLALLDTHHLLLTVGDFSKDGMRGEQPLAQDRGSSYGKIVKIDIESGNASLFSLGHRNPQGLHVDRQGAIWETEHGPKGGDELNLITEGLNYGWPFVTYGTHNLSHSWPMSATPGEHIGYQRPVFSWIPDVAVSNLIRIKGQLFDEWQDDLLIGTYTKTLLRIRIKEGRVIYAEPIIIRNKNARIRDILEDASGKIILLLDSGAIVTMQPAADIKVVPNGMAGADSMRAQLLFTQCKACHDVGDGVSHRIGPDLANIMNRPIGRAANFSYSKALSGLQDKWTADKLDQFLRDPKAFAPGTSMVYPGIRESADRAALLEYLKTLK